MKRSLTMAQNVLHDSVGKSKGIQYDNIPGLDTLPVSLSIWVKRIEAATVVQHLIWVDQTAADADDAGVRLLCDSISGDLRFDIKTDAVFPLKGTSNPFPIGEWVHVVGTWDGVVANQPYLYVNGIWKGAGTSGTGNRASAPGSHSFGGRESTQARGWGGLLAGAGRWTRVLKESEIKALAGGAHPLDFPAGLVICPDFATLENVAPLRTSPMPNLRENEGSVYMGPPQLREPTSRKTKFALADPLPQTRVLDVPQVWTKQPPPGTPVDWANPITKGLVRAVIPSETGFVYNSATRKHLTLTAGTPSWTTNQYGRAQLGSETGSSTTFVTYTTDEPFSALISPSGVDGDTANAAISQMCVIHIRQPFGTGEYFCGESGASNADRAWFSLLTVSSRIRYAVGTAFTGPNIDLGGTNDPVEPVAGGYYTLIGTFDNATGAMTFRARRLDTGGFGFGTDTVVTADDLDDIIRFSFSNHQNVSVMMYASWKRLLTEGEQSDLEYGFWQIFKRDNMHVPIEHQELTFDSDSEERLFMIPQKNTRQPR